MGRHDYFMGIALEEAEKALTAGEFPVGCVVTLNGKVIGQGHRQQSVADSVNELDHAEIITLRDVTENQPEIELGKTVVYSTLEPCLMCYAALLLNGVRSIVYGYEDIMGGATQISLAQLAPLYREMEVQIIPHIRRRESVSLFKRFFQNPLNSYWQNSVLAKYTLAQAHETGKKV